MLLQCPAALQQQATGLNANLPWAMQKHHVSTRPPSAHCFISCLVIEGTRPKLVPRFCCVSVAHAPGHSLLNTCNNQLLGDAPTWLGPLGNLTALTQRTVTLAECGISVASCTAGFICSTTSLSVVANPCAPGLFSSSGASVCTDCPVGTYSDTAGTAVCSSCPAGRYGSTAGLSTPGCTDACSAGRFGAPRSNSSACTGPCDAGRWGGVEQSSSQCSGACSAGYVMLLWLTCHVIGLLPTCVTVCAWHLV